MTELCVTRVFSRVSWTGGPERSTPFQIPPPCDTPVGPDALPTLPVTWTLRRSSRLLLKIPAPCADAEPVVLDAVAVLPLMMRVLHRHELRVIVEVVDREPGARVGRTGRTVLRLPSCR